MNLLRRFFILSALALLWLPSTKASHQMGADFTFECINGCTTRVHFRAYRDCMGASGIGNNITWTPQGPGCTAPTPIGNWSTQTTVEVTPICPSASTYCTNPNSNINGVQEYYWYRDYNICVASPGCSFEVSTGSCCRNGVITSGASNQGLYFSSIYTVTAGCNSSPEFTNNPIFYACAGLPYQIHQGGYDPDGDSLVYVLSPCMDVANTPVTYTAGYSPTAPLGPSWAVSLDPVTGILSMNPQPGNLVVGVVCITVQEYRNGNLIGSTTRDMQVTVGNYCAAPYNVPVLSGATNAQNCSIVAPNTVAVCGGTSFCFDIHAYDADSMSQNVTLSWDGNAVGGTFTEIGTANTNSFSGNSPDGRFCWTSPNVPGVYEFLVRAADDGCPIPLFREELFRIIVGGGSSSANIIAASGTLDYCAGTADTLSVVGVSGSYLWSTAATTQMILVNSPGWYMVTVTTPTGCLVTDSHYVAPPAPIDIDGTITDHLSNPLANQRVWLVGHDTTNNSLYLVDSTFTNSSGYYKFCSVSPDTVWVKAAPSIGAYPNELPTYADTSLFWVNARPILATSFPTTVNFATINGTNPGGIGFIGGLVTQGANKTTAPGDPVAGVTIFAYSQTLGRYVGYATSDINGYISYYFLTPGDYTFVPDKPGVSILNVPTATLTANNMVLDSLDFRLHTTYLEIVDPVLGQTPTQPGFSVQVYPNPITDRAILQVSMDATKEVTWKVTDLQGRTLAVNKGLLTKGIHQIPLSASALGMPAGTYFLHLRAGDAAKVVKLTVIR